MNHFVYNPPQEPLTYLYQDEHYVVVDKPSGLLSVPGRDPKNYDSVWSRVKEEFPEAQPIHRLDTGTSGIMLLSKQKPAERELKRQFRDRETLKMYVARVWGRPAQAEGEIDLPLICDWPNRPRQKICYTRGKPSQTQYEVVDDGAENALIKLYPITGRSHQLRLHLMAIGHPILGDKFYAAPEGMLASPRLQLHARELSFTHPETGEFVTYTSPASFE